MVGNRISVEKSAAKKCGCSVGVWRLRRAAGLLWYYHCRGWKEEDQFTIDKERSSGKAAICKPCNSQRSLRSRYGISREDVENLTRSHCPICDRDDQTMVLDHNHDTGAVRGFLCNRCNVGLGQFCDDIALLKSAIEYLEKHRG